MTRLSRSRFALNGVRKLRLSRIAMIFIATAFFTPLAGADVVDRIVAIVNDDIISLYELESMMAPYRERVKSADYPKEKESELLFQVREEILNQLIDRKLTDQEIERNRIRVSEDEIDKAVEQVKANNGYSDEDLRLTLQTEGMSMEEYREKMRERILRSKLVNIQVKSKIIITDEDVRKYYESHPEEFSGEDRYHLRNILIKIPFGAVASERRSIRERMEKIVARATSSEAFAKMAKAHSEGPRADQGGDLGDFAFSDLSEQLREALEGVKAGEVTPVIETDLGFQVFFVEDIVRSSGKSLERATAEIQERLFSEIVNEKFQDWLSELRQQSHIKIIR